MERIVSADSIWIYGFIHHLNPICTFLCGKASFSANHTQVFRFMSSSKEVWSTFRKQKSSIVLFKAPCTINWTIWMQILKETGIDWRERRLIRNLYIAQSVKVRLNRGETRSVKIGRRVRQGCCLSLILFNLYSEYLTKGALEGLGDFKISFTLWNMQMTLCYWLRKKRCYRTRLIN